MAGRPKRVPLVLTAALVLGALSLPLSAASSGAVVSLRAVGARPALVPGAEALGPLGARTELRGVIALKPNSASSLARYVTGVSDPTSPLYRHYLRPGEFASRFGPSKEVLASLRKLLHAARLDVTGVARSGLLVSFAGPASRVAAEFHTAFVSYRLPGGKKAYAPTSRLELPSRVGVDVAGVLGLEDEIHPRPVGALVGAKGHVSAKRPKTVPVKGLSPRACNAALGDATSYGGLTDQQLAQAYGVDPLYGAGADGSGETIAVYELEPFSMSDLEAFDNCYYGAAEAARMASRVKVIGVDGGQQAGAGSGEAELDVEDVTALAPGANIQVYEAPNTFMGLIDNFDAIISKDAARIVTSSWYSGCEAAVEAYEPTLPVIENEMFEQAAAQGQTILEAVGDNGSDGCSPDGSSPTPPILSGTVEADQPYVLAVGGTTITDATTPPSEQVWNDGAGSASTGGHGAGGGGISSIWPAPAWQADSLVGGVDNKGVLKTAEKLNGGPFCAASLCREVPDVSADADEFTGAITIYDSEDGGWITIGGTSSSTPLWAGMLADIDSTAACKATGGVGFVDPALYAIASIPSEYKASFNDITTGNNDLFGAADGLFPATAGYNMAGGLGSPKVTGAGGAPGLAHYLCTSGAGATPTVRSLSPDAVPSTGGAVTLVGSGFEGTSGTSDVAGVTVGSVALGKGDYDVDTATEISVDLPPASSETGGLGDYDVSVTLTDGKTSTPNVASRAIYYPASSPSSEAPEVSGVSSVGNNEAGGMTATIFGSGFEDPGAGTPAVSFGGVAASGVTVVSDNELTATVPSYSANTACAPGDDPTTDICQAEVQVTDGNGTSTESTIEPEFYGNTAEEGEAGTGEFLPAPSEFDYFPTPKISSITVESGILGVDAAQASEAGGSVAVIDGVGLGNLGADWVNVGPYNNNNSFTPGYVSFGPDGSQVVIELPPISPTTGEVAVPVTVQTEGSLNNSSIGTKPPSNTVAVTYAGTPVVTSIGVLAGGSPHYLAGPASGGTRLVIRGSGLNDAVAVQFTDTGDGSVLAGEYGFSDATSFNLSPVSQGAVVIDTPADDPGVDQVSVCSASGCSTPAGRLDVFTYYPVGRPSLLAIRPSKGPAGTRVVITGANLGFLRAVFFGKTRAKRFINAGALLDSGSTTTISATVPGGRVGKTAEVRVETLESLATGSGKTRVNPAVHFRFEKEKKKR